MRARQTIVDQASEAERSGERQWIEAAIRHLAKANVDDIRIEELSRELGVSKGSFYWHFRNREHLLDRVLEYWLDRATLQVTRWAREGQPGAREKLARILSLPAKAPPEKRGADLEMAIRSWARRDVRAADMVQKVDGIRAEFLHELMRELGFEGDEVRRRAMIAQAFMLGEAFLKLGVSRAERLEAVAVCTEMLAAGRLDQDSGDPDL
jgi:AcrR family transcriptional regulator